MNKTLENILFPIFISKTVIILTKKTSKEKHFQHQVTIFIHNHAGEYDNRGQS